MGEFKLFATQETPRCKTPLVKVRTQRATNYSISVEKPRSLSQIREIRPKSAQRVRRSSFAKKRADNFSVTIGEQQVTKFQIKRLYDIFKSISNVQGFASTAELRQALQQQEDLKEDSYKLNTNMDFVDFFNMLSMIYRTANQQQIRRLVRIIDPNLEPETPLIPSQDTKKRISFRSAKIYPQLFYKFERDQEGFIHFRSFKKVLFDKFNEVTILKLFDQYRRGLKGINLESFIEMFAPKNVLITQDVLNKLIAYKA